MKFINICKNVNRWLLPPDLGHIKKSTKGKKIQHRTKKNKENNFNLLYLKVLKLHYYAL